LERALNWSGYILVTSHENIMHVKFDQNSLELGRSEVLRIDFFKCIDFLKRKKKDQNWLFYSCRFLVDAKYFISEMIKSPSCALGFELLRLGMSCFVRFISALFQTDFKPKLSHDCRHNLASHC